MPKDKTPEQLALLAWLLANGFAELIERNGKIYPVSKI